MSQEHVSNSFEKFRLWLDPQGLVTSRHGGTGNWPNTALMVLALKRQGPLPEWLEEGLGQVLLTVLVRPKSATELAAFWIVAGNDIVMAPWRTLIAKLGAPSTSFFWFCTFVKAWFQGDWLGAYLVLEVWPSKLCKRFYKWRLKAYYTSGLGQFLTHTHGRAHPLTQMFWDKP